MRHFTQWKDRSQVQMTAEDFEQPLCAICSRPISDDRLDGPGRKVIYCSTKCGHRAYSLRRAMAREALSIR